MTDYGTKKAHEFDKYATTKPACLATAALKPKTHVQETENWSMHETNNETKQEKGYSMKNT